jgi:ABC-2 type transport system ATP-binding protein
VLEIGTEALAERYREVAVRPEQVAAARALRPFHERQAVGRSVMLFDGGDAERLAALGEVRTPSIADLFVAVVGGQARPAAAPVRGAAPAQGVAR